MFENAEYAKILEISEYTPWVWSDLVSSQVWNELTEQGISGLKGCRAAKGVDVYIV
jgi:hypothetical protein